MSHFNNFFVPIGFCVSISFWGAGAIQKEGSSGFQKACALHTAHQDRFHFCAQVCVTHWWRFGNERLNKAGLCDTPSMRCFSPNIRHLWISFSHPQQPGWTNFTISGEELGVSEPDLSELFGRVPQAENSCSPVMSVFLPTDDKDSAGDQVKYTHLHNTHLEDTHLHLARWILALGGNNWFWATPWCSQVKDAMKMLWLEERSHWKPHLAGASALWGYGG